MAYTAGVLSQVSVTDTTATILSTAPTGGTGPYTQQLYKSTTPGFTPGAGNLVAGATALQNTVTGLIPGTIYYYSMIYTDTGDSNALETVLAQLLSVSAPTLLSPNQFAISSYPGALDLQFNPDTVSVQIDATQLTPLYAGAAVKMVDSAGGVPKVVGCTADTDEVLGFLNYDAKSVQFLAGHMAEMSMDLNVMYLYSTGPIARGAEVTLDLTTNGGVGAAVGSSGKRIVGWAYDKFTGAGQLKRIFIKTPSYKVA